MDDTAKKLEKFWEIVLGVWNHGFMGVSVGQIVEALAIFMVFMAGRQLFTKAVLASLRKWAAKTKTEHDDQVIEALEDPVGFIPISLGAFFAFEHLTLSGRLSGVTDNLVTSLVTFNLFWALVRIVDPLSFILTGLEKLFTRAMLQWLTKGIKAAFILVGGAAILETWGIKVAPLIAGLGLFGVAVALGAQDMFKNLIGGLLVLAEKRFHPGDWIKVDGIVEGTVEDIGFRSTMIRRFDKAPVFVPNAKLSDNAVTNFSAMTHRRIYWKIGVEYSTTISQLRIIRDSIEQFIWNSPEFASPEEVSTFVRIDSFNDSSIDILVYCFTKTTRWGEWLEIKEKLAYEIKKIVEGAGSGFAFPSQSVYVESLPSDSPESFVPPAAGQTTPAVQGSRVSTS